MVDRLGQGDLLAGAVAAAVLLLLTFPLGVTPWLAVPLAVATYAGAALLRPRIERGRQGPVDDARREQLAYQTALTRAATIRAQAPRIVKPSAREHVSRISGRIDRVLAVMREDGKLTAAPLFNDQLLAPFEALLTKYVHLTIRGVKSAANLLEKTETRDLPMFEQAVDAFYETLHRADVVDLAALGEVLEFNLETIATTPRRVTP